MSYIPQSLMSPKRNKGNERKKSFARPINPGINFAGMPAAMRRREEEKAAKNAPKIEVKKKTARSPKTKKKN